MSLKGLVLLVLFVLCGCSSTNTCTPTPGFIKLEGDAVSYTVVDTEFRAEFNLLSETITLTIANARAYVVPLTYAVGHRTINLQRGGEIVGYLHYEVCAGVVYTQIEVLDIPISTIAYLIEAVIIARGENESILMPNTLHALHFLKIHSNLV